MTTRYNDAHSTSELHPTPQQTTTNNHSTTIEQHYARTGDFLALSLLRNIEDQIFAEASEAWEVLNDQPIVRVDGKTYAEIQKCPQLSKELEKVRTNSPIYQNLSTRKKHSLFLALGAQYQLRLKNSLTARQLVKSLEGISETLEASQTESFNTKKYSKKITKKAKAHLSKQIGQLSSGKDEETSVSKICKPKKVCFTDESALKYFSKSDPSGLVAFEEQLICQTFCIK